MKNLFLIISILLFTSEIIYAQEETTGELVIHLTNRTSTWNVTIKLTAVSARWDSALNLTTDHEIVSENLTNPDGKKAKFDHILDPGVHDTFAICLYKISAIENSVEKAYFYMDWRTSNWSSSLDVQFKYDFSTKNFRDYYSNDVIDYSYQTLWDLTNNSLVTSGLEDYWENCLALINDGNNHPKLVWGPYPQYISGAITGYNVYSANHVQGIPPENFSLLANLESDDFDYVDNTITIGSGINSRSYYVKCVFEDQTENTGETDPTNTVEVNIENPSKRSVVFNSQKNNSYGLEQNYPNPFNPATVIYFSIPETNFTTLKVFDVLGNEIITLVNGLSEAGIHSVEFYSSSLPSGIYFYQLHSGNFIETKKMILMR